jgi:hypothetical protein
MSERIDGQIREAVCEAAGEPRSELRARALEAMADVRPRRAIRGGRLAVVGIAAGVLLIGLGFVPFPRRSAERSQMGAALEGLLDQAMAAAEQARSVHLTGDGWTATGELHVERWFSDDGFRRMERWENGSLALLALSDGDTETWYKPLSAEASVRYVPPMRGKATTSQLYESWTDSISDLGDPLSMADCQISEHREVSPSGGARRVVEAQGVFAAGASMQIQGVRYEGGDRFKVHVETEAETGRLVLLKLFRLDGELWGQVYEESAEWDVRIPEDVRQFDLPEGTRVRCDRWWERTRGVIARGESEDWEVVLHAIDVNRRGDLYVTFARWLRADGGLSRSDSQVFPRVQATGDAGVRYVQVENFVGACRSGDQGGYWVPILRREATGVPLGLAGTVTVTVYPYPRGETADQSVTFRGVPLPPRQNVDDPIAEAVEVIQY